MLSTPPTGDLFSPREDQEWFADEMRETRWLDDGAITRAWLRAREHGEGALREPWRGWVRQMVQLTRSKAKSGPAGYLLRLLENGPAEDLSSPAPEPERTETPAETRARWTREDLERQKREAAELPFAGRKTRPPLWLGLRAVEAGRDPHEVYEAWEAAGFPPPEEFQGPALLEG